jgi:predicted kinase
MLANTQPADAWTFPFTPQPPDWKLDWDSLAESFSWLRALAGTPQEPEYHGEGDVFIHTRMVAEAMIALPSWHSLPASERSLLFASALLHDVGKPAMTHLAADGRISSRGHARKGELLTRRILCDGQELPPVALQAREYIARLVRFHGLPLRFLDSPNPQRSVIEASQSVRLSHLTLLAEADVCGRICADQDELLTRIELFNAFCQEQECYDAPRQFATSHSRFTYFQKEQSDPAYVAYDETQFEVVLMSGLPGSGKDTWLKTNVPELPVVSLDELRRELRIAPTDDQGRVIQAARERARVMLRQKMAFAWNATNITRQLRQQLIDLFVSYGARVRLVYLDASLPQLLERNRARRAYVPEAVLQRLLNKLEVPDLTEAQQVEWIESM